MRVPVTAVRWLGVAAALLVLAGCQKGQPWQNWSPTAPTPARQIAGFIERQTETQRFLDEQGFTSERGAAQRIRPAPSTISSSYFENESNQQICRLALLKYHPKWDSLPEFRQYVDESKSRGLTEQQCARLSGRFNEQQIAAVHGPAAFKSRPAPPKPNPPSVRPNRKPKIVAKVAPKKPKPSPRAQSGTGSGFFVSRLGHVITNAHVVRDCKRITVGNNANSQTPAALLDSDGRNDLALLKLQSLDTVSANDMTLVRNLGISIVPLAADGLLRSEDVVLGEDILVAGFPFGAFVSNSIKVTKGIVSSTRGLGDNSGQFQIDAAAQAGNSGGPIYDENGNIVGVVVAQLDKKKFAKIIGSTPENVNFGIKASTVRQFLTSSGLPSKWSTRSKKMSSKQLASIAKKQTLMVICHRIREQQTAAIMPLPNTRPKSAAPLPNIRPKSSIKPFGESKTFALPIDCTPGRDCWVANYVDVNPGKGARDYAGGVRTFDGNKSIDFAIRDVRGIGEGVPIRAVADGVVLAVREGMPDLNKNIQKPKAYRGRECGNAVVVRHDADWRTQYCHMRKGSVAVAKGQRVNTGALLGLVGLSGGVEFPHMTFLVFFKGQPIDPFTGARAKDGIKIGKNMWGAEARAMLQYRKININFDRRQPTRQPTGH